MDKLAIGDKVRIKPGTPISHDFGFFLWPETRNIDPADVDTIFTVRAYLDSKCVDLTADNFGARDKYGNGCITVSTRHELVKI